MKQITRTIQSTLINAVKVEYKTGEAPKAIPIEPIKVFGESLDQQQALTYVSKLVKAGKLPQEIYAIDSVEVIEKSIGVDIDLFVRIGSLEERNLKALIEHLDFLESTANKVDEAQEQSAEK